MYAYHSLSIVGLFGHERRSQADITASIFTKATVARRVYVGVWNIGTAA